MRKLSHHKLNNKLVSGRLYKRASLKRYSTAVDRDLTRLVQDKQLKKIAPGLYYKPKESRYGPLPPDDTLMVAEFLREKNFLLYSWNVYNSLGLGLTQIYNRKVVYNRKRHGVFELSGREYDFRRPARGYPSKLTPEFLLVDLVNNLKELDEDSAEIKKRIKKKLSSFNAAKVMQYARKYGKVATLRFFEELNELT